MTICSQVARSSGTRNRVHGRGSACSRGRWSCTAGRASRLRAVLWGTGGRKPEQPLHQLVGLPEVMQPAHLAPAGRPAPRPGPGTAPDPGPGPGSVNQLLGIRSGCPTARPRACCRRPGAGRSRPPGSAWLRAGEPRFGSGRAGLLALLASERVAAGVDDDSPALLDHPAGASPDGRQHPTQIGWQGEQRRRDGLGEAQSGGRELGKLPAPSWPRCGGALDTQAAGLAGCGTVHPMSVRGTCP